MTSKRAERIMSMEVRRIPSDLRQYVYGAFNGGPEPIVRASGLTPAEALKRLVCANYERVGDIVFNEQRWRCAACYRLSPLQRHHIIPRSKGRVDKRENLVALDHGCHQAITDGRAVLEIHPRMVEVMRELGLRYTPTGWERC